MPSGQQWKILKIVCLQERYKRSHLRHFKKALKACEEEKVHNIGQGSHATVCADTASDNLSESRWRTKCTTIRLNDSPSSEFGEIRQLSLTECYAIKIIHGVNPWREKPSLGAPFPTLEIAQQELARLVTYLDMLTEAKIPRLPVLVAAIVKNNDGYSLMTLDVRAEGYDDRLSASRKETDDEVFVKLLMGTGYVEQIMIIAERFRKRNGNPASEFGLDTSPENFFGYFLVDVYPSLVRGYLDGNGGAYEKTAMRKRLYTFAGQLQWLITYCVQHFPAHAYEIMRTRLVAYSNSTEFPEAQRMVTEGLAYQFWRANCEERLAMASNEMTEMLRVSLNDVRLMVMLIRADLYRSLDDPDIGKHVAIALELTTRQREIPLAERAAGLAEHMCALLERSANGPDKILSA